MFAPGDTSLLFLRPGPIGAYDVTARGQGQFPVVADDEAGCAPRAQPLGRHAGAPRAASTSCSGAPPRCRRPPRPRGRRRRPRHRRRVGRGACALSCEPSSFASDSSPTRRATRAAGMLAAGVSTACVATVRSAAAFCRTMACPLPPGFSPSRRRLRPPRLRLLLRVAEPAGEAHPRLLAQRLRQLRHPADASAQVPYDKAVDAVRAGVREVDQHHVRRRRPRDDGPAAARQHRRARPRPRGLRRGPVQLRPRQPARHHLPRQRLALRTTRTTRSG